MSNELLIGFKYDGHKSSNKDGFIIGVDQISEMYSESDGLDEYTCVVSKTGNKYRTKDRIQYVAKSITDALSERLDAELAVSSFGLAFHQPS